MNKSTEVQTRKEVLNQTGFSKATLYRRIEAGLWPPSFKTGGRSVGFLFGETTQVIAAYANNYTPIEVKTLVQKLIKDRQNLFESLRKQASC